MPSLKLMWNVVKEIRFDYYRITRNFNPMSFLSSIDLAWDEVRSDDDDMVAFSSTTEDIYLFNDETARDIPDEKAKFIKNGAQLIVWPPHLKDNYNEKDVLVAIARDIFIPLCKAEEVIFEMEYSSKVKEEGLEVRTEHIGIGKSCTWHGTPDMRVRGCEVIALTKEDDVDSEDEEDGDVSIASLDGATVHVEGKKRMSLAANFSQLVGTCVTSSFTEHKLHPTQNPLIPTILIDANQFRVCLYDCVEDVLLISEPKLLSHNGERLSTTAMFFLYLTINHR